MNICDFRKIDSERINTALHDENIEGLIRSTLIQRNIFLCFFIICFLSILACALLGLSTLTVVALFLTTISLVITTKYNTHLLFLRIIQRQNRKKEEQGKRQIPED